MPRNSATIDPYAPSLEVAQIEDQADTYAVSPDPLVPADGEWTRATMKRFLDAQPKRAVAISRDHNDKQGVKAYHDVWYQGFRWPIEKGKSVLVPEPIAQIVEQMDREYRTTQARNQAAFLNDITTADGAEIHVDGGGSR